MCSSIDTYLAPLGRAAPEVFLPWPTMTLVCCALVLVGNQRCRHDAVHMPSRNPVHLGCIVVTTIYTSCVQITGRGTTIGLLDETHSGSASKAQQSRIVGMSISCPGLPEIKGHCQNNEIILLLLVVPTRQTPSMTSEAIISYLRYLAWFVYARLPDFSASRL